MKDKRSITSKENGKLGGRPSKFKPEYIDAIIEFFDIEPYKKEIIEQAKEFFADGSIKKENEKFIYKPNKMPTLYRFARKIGVEYETVWRWAEQGKDIDEEGEWVENKTPDFLRFFNAYKEAKELQKEFLISIGLANAAPSAFAIFTAKNVTDMRDKIETDITSKGEKVESINYIVPEKIKRAEEKSEDNN